MAQPRIPFETPNSNPNWVYGNNAAPTMQPAGRDILSRPNHIFGGGDTVRGPTVTDAEFRNAKPIGPTTIKDISSPYGKYGEAATKAGAKVGAALDKAGSAVHTVANTPGVQLAGRVLSAADMAHQGLRSIDGFESGDNVTGGYHGARAAIALGAGMGNPLAMAAGGGLAAGDMLYDYGLSDDTKGSIGSGVNKLVRGAGRMIGQDWGVDPVQGDAAVFGGSAAPAGPSRNTPTVAQNPLRVQERNAGIANPGATPVQGAELRFGGASPAGTFGGGYTDMGGGIAGKGSGSRGQANDFTNIGANGQATAMSQVDSRTPDQIANGERIKAQTAATVAAAGGLGNLQRQNAMMAANIRDGVDPHQGFNGPTASIINTGLRGNMRVNDQGGNSVVDTVKELRSAGIKVSHNTLRQIMQGDAQMKTNAASNAAQLAANANSVDAQREQAQLSHGATMYGHDINAANNRATIKSQMYKAMIDQGNKDREFGLQLTQEERATRTEGDKRIGDLAKSYATGPNGEVNAAKENEYVTGAHSLLGNAIAAAEKRGDMATARELQKTGIGALDSRDVQQHVARLRMRDVSRGAHGIAPWSGSHVEGSPDGYDVREVKRGMLFDTATLNNGSTVPSLAINGMNPFSPTTTVYDSIGGRKLRQE